MFSKHIRAFVAIILIETIVITSGIYIPKTLHKFIRDVPTIKFGNWRPIPNNRPSYPKGGK